MTVALAAPAASPATAVERLLDDHGWGSPARDADLDAVAVHLADRLSAPTDALFPEANAEQLRFLLASRRISAAHVYPFTVRYQVGVGIGEHLPALLGRLDRRLPPTHYGLATYGRGRVLTTTVLLVHRGVSLDAPLRRTANVATMMTVGGDLRRGYFKPRAIVAPPRGAPVRERPAWTKERRAEVTIYFDSGPGPYGIELVADSQYGPVVLTNHTVYVGVDPPALPTLRLRPTDRKGLAPSDALLALVNELRVNAGLPRLRHHPTLESIATTHAEDMAQQRRLFHASPDTGTLSTRLRAAGMQVSSAAENLAEAADPRAALGAFLASPGHKRNLLLPDVTHAGVGVKGRYYAVALVQLK